MPSSVAKVTRSIGLPPSEHMAAAARMTGTAFALRDPYPWGHLSGLARIGESLGYQAMFMPEVGSRDVLAALTGIAGDAEALMLGSGVLLNWGPRGPRGRAREQLAEGAAEAGRDPNETSVGVYVRACVHADAAAARLAVSTAAAEYASSPAYARQFAQMGLGEEARQAAAAHAAARPADVPERFVRAVAAPGDPAHARAQQEDDRAARRTQ